MTRVLCGRLEKWLKKHGGLQSEDSTPTQTLHAPLSSQTPTSSSSVLTGIIPPQSTSPDLSQPILAAQVSGRSADSQTSGGVRQVPQQHAQQAPPQQLQKPQQLQQQHPGVTTAPGDVSSPVLLTQQQQHAAAVAVGGQAFVPSQNSPHPTHQRGPSFQQQPQVTPGMLCWCFIWGLAKSCAPTTKMKNLAWVVSTSRGIDYHWYCFELLFLGRFCGYIARILVF